MVPNHWNLLGKPEKRRINLEKKIPNRDFALGRQRRNSIFENLHIAGKYQKNNRSAIENKGSL
ncbi:hypothetical protein [Victivallis vadensis]|uniref:hypothetical protein n=1 Tax=Victivallis vadensis TaxID=172901 RepID=UPI00307FACF0